MRLTPGSAASVRNAIQRRARRASSSPRLLDLGQPLELRLLDRRRRCTASAVAPSSPSVKPLTPTRIHRPVVELALELVGGVGDLGPGTSRPRCAAIDAVEHRAVAELVEVGEHRLGLALRARRSATRRTTSRRAGRRRGRRRSRGRSTCWVRRAMRAAFSVGSASASSKLSVCRLWVPPSTPASASMATRAMLTSGCWAVSDTPAVWVWNRSCSERSATRAVAVAQPPGPDAAGGAVLGDLLEEVDVGVEEEAEPGRERRRSSRPAAMRRLDVGEAVGEGERQLLGGRRARLADVVAGDRDRVPARHLGGAEAHHVAHQPHRRPRREDELLLGLVLLQDVVLDGAAEAWRAARPCWSPSTTYMASTIAAGELIVIDVVTEPRSMSANRSRHVGEGVDGHAGAPDLAQRRARRRSRGPSSVGMSNAVDRPLPPDRRSSLNRALVSSAVPNPANWRMVQSRDRYIEA